MLRILIYIEQSATNILRSNGKDTAYEETINWECPFLLLPLCRWMMIKIYEKGVKFTSIAMVLI